MKNKALLLSLGLMGVLLSGCVKYNGRDPKEESFKFSLSANTKSIILNESAVIKAGSNLDVTLNVNWTMADGAEEFISLDKNSGLEVTVSALKLGETSIFASTTYKGTPYKAECKIKVSDSMSITLSTTAISIKEGESAKLSATIDRDVTVNWSLPDNEQHIASFDTKTGLEVTVTGLSSGTTTITATASYNDLAFTATCKLTVARKDGEGGGGDPIVGEEVTTYLVIGENGRYNGEQGKDIPSLFLEYAVEFVAKVGEDLPGEDVVTSVVKDSKFKYWQAYNGDGALTKYTTVPDARGKILYACFGGGGGSVNPDVPTPTPSGSITLYFDGLSSWTDLGSVVVNLGINDNFITAQGVGTGVYQATIPVSGSVSRINAYMTQGDNKWFHPFNGVQNYDTMDSSINPGSVSVELGGTYTITWADWAYHGDDSHSWFKYSFKEGAPSDTPTPPPTPPTGDITLYFAGVGEFGNISSVHFALDSNWKAASKHSGSEGQYVVVFSNVASASALNFYFDEYNGSQWRHPACGADNWDTNYSTISTGTVTLTAGHSYVLTWIDWEKHYDNWEHAWFTYTFAQLS